MPAPGSWPPRWPGSPRSLPTAGPHIVSIVFAGTGDTIVTAVGDKPKRNRGLQRLRNIEQSPLVSVLADHYDEDWTRLWWVRADGAGRIVEASRPGVDLLVAKYPQ